MKGITKNQAEVLTYLKKGGPDGNLDFDQLLEQLSWEPTKAAAQFTIRALIGKGLIEKLPSLELRRSRQRICYQLTAEGKSVLDPRPPSLSVGISSIPGVSEDLKSVNDDDFGFEKDWIEEISG